MARVVYDNVTKRFGELPVLRDFSLGIEDGEPAEVIGFRTPSRRLFGKLYAENHLCADRWYKLGRTVMYGALEDERSFNSVRRMVEL